MFKLIVCTVMSITLLAADAATRPVLRPIELTESVSLLKYTLHVTIGPDGKAHSMRKMGDVAEGHSGNLSQAQIVELSALFADWEKWESEYPGVPDGGNISLKYGIRAVRGGHLPKELSATCERIHRLAESLPKDL